MTNSLLWLNPVPSDTILLIMADRRFVYDHPRPAVTVDVVCCRYSDGRGQVALVRRAREPFAGAWALPGGFVNIGEDISDAARRELAEETGLKPIWIEQFYCFGTPGRDPRGRTISVAYVARVDPTQTGRAADDAAQLRWFDMEDLPTLAFDHDRIIKKARPALADWQKLGRIE